MRADTSDDVTSPSCEILSVHAPWEADKATLKKAGITLGETYPKPIVDHSAARQRALDAYDTLKEKRDAS